MKGARAGHRVRRTIELKSPCGRRWVLLRGVLKLELFLWLRFRLYIMRGYKYYYDEPGSSEVGSAQVRLRKTDVLSLSGERGSIHHHPES